MVIADQRACLFVIGQKTRPQTVGVVIGTGLATGCNRFGGAAQHTFDKHVIIDLQFDHMIKALPHVRQQITKGICLRQSARKAVKDETTMIAA